MRWHSFVWLRCIQMNCKDCVTTKFPVPLQGNYMCVVSTHSLEIMLNLTCTWGAGKLHVCSLHPLFGNYVKSHVYMGSAGSGKLCLGRSTSPKDSAFFDQRLSHVTEMTPSCQWLWRWILWDINSGSQNKNQRMSLDM